MELVVGSAGTGKTQYLINEMWASVRTGLRCMLFETSLDPTGVKKRIVEGNFKSGTRRIIDRGEKPDDTDLDALLSLNDPTMPVYIHCEKPESPDIFLPWFGGHCAGLGAGGCGERPVVLLDVLQDLPWFDGVSASSSFRHYLKEFETIEDNSGVRMVVAVQLLHKVNEDAADPAAIRDMLHKTYPELSIDKLTVCLDSYTDKYGRRRIKSTTVDL